MNQNLGKQIKSKYRRNTDLKFINRGDSFKLMQSYALTYRGNTKLSCVLSTFLKDHCPEVLTGMIFQCLSYTLFRFCFFVRFKPQPFSKIKTLFHMLYHYFLPLLFLFKYIACPHLQICLDTPIYPHI